MTIVATPAHPTTWDGNFVIAGPGVEAAAVFAALERFGGWQVVQVDCLTDPGVEAALALAGFEAATTLIEMIADTVASPLPLPAVDLLPVGEPEWGRFAVLVEADHREGKRTGKHDAAVAAGLLVGMRARLGTCAYWLLVEDGIDAGYGMTAVCPNGLGLIEHLFTLPERRGRGLMRVHRRGRGKAARGGVRCGVSGRACRRYAEAALRAAGVRARRADADVGEAGRLTGGHRHPRIGEGWPVMR